MKYIRTKDGKIIKIIKVVHNIYISDTNEYCCNMVAEADTIEELCDEFVVEDRDEFAIFHNLKLAKKTKGIIFGAIWTDKGLIYVAKMNDKGELELL